MKADVRKITETILAIERSINERWNNGDCNGFLETYSDDMIYFDPATEKLLVGHKAVEDHIRKMYKHPHIVRGEYINPQVTVDDNGEFAILSYNLRNYVAGEAGGEKLQANWNTTEVYRLIDGKWRIVHSHWSFAQHPAIMQNLIV